MRKLIFLIYPLFWLYVSTYSGREYTEALAFLVHSSIFFCIIAYWGGYKRNIDIYSPFVLISILYFLLFFLAPSTFIMIGDTNCHGDEVMNGCSTGTMYALLSYISLTFGYRQYKGIPNKTIAIPSYIFVDKNKLLTIMFFFWLIGAISCIVYINDTGVSIYYLLLGGDNMITENKIGNSNLKFLASFAYFMVFPVITFFVFNRNKLVVALLFFLTFTLFYVRGTRIFILILILSLLILYTRINQRKIKLRWMLIGFVLLLTLFSFMGTNRKSLKAGIDIEYNISISDYVGTLTTNFDIYKPYYGLVANCPEKYPHTLGSAMIIESLESFIPRFLWPTKRSITHMSECMMKTTGDGPISAAMSWPNVAEYYMEFGIIGVILLSYIFGYLMSYSKQLYNSPKLSNIMAYSALFPTFFQLVIRGYTPGNVTMYACIFLPYLIVIKLKLIK